MTTITLVFENDEAAAWFHQMSTEHKNDKERSRPAPLTTGILLDSLKKVSDIQSSATLDDMKLARMYKG